MPKYELYFILRFLEYEEHQLYEAEVEPNYKWTFKYSFVRSNFEKYLDVEKIMGNIEGCSTLEECSSEKKCPSMDWEKNRIRR